MLGAYLVRESPTTKLRHGPIWDFDRATTKSNDTDPTHNLDWVKDRLLLPPLQRAGFSGLIDKWQNLRRAAPADSNLLAT